MNIKDYIRTVPDYPVKGINFYDLNSLFSSNVWHTVVANLAKELLPNSGSVTPTHIVGIESRGFVVGAALAHELGIPFVMVRKKGAKYPGRLLEETYDLEYGSDTLTIQEGILDVHDNVIIADDLVATGGSMNATARLVEQTDATVLAGVTIVNLKYLNPTSMDSFPLVSAYEATE